MSEEEKSDEYTEEMQARMGTTLTYRHEDGINWNAVTPDLIVGSCLQTPADADRLAKEGITTVFSLQVIIALHAPLGRRGLLSGIVCMCKCATGG